MPQLFIATYQPREGNYYHWALHLKTDSEEEDYIFEVVGSHPDFRRNVVRSKPESTTRHTRSIKGGDDSRARC